MSRVVEQADGRLARIRHHAFLAILVAAAWIALAGCKGGEPEDEPVAMPEAIPQNEIDRGVAACRAYQERVCACAAARQGDAELRESCDLAPAKLSSLELVLTLNRSPGSLDERVSSNNTARRIMASCITAQADLDGKGCPRPKSE